MLEESQAEGLQVRLDHRQWAGHSNQNLKYLRFPWGSVDILGGAGPTLILGSVYAGGCHPGAHLADTLDQLINRAGYQPIQT